MSLLIQKFGGTSVGTPERVQSVAQRIARCRAEGHGLVVVVSAMGQTTDELIDLAYRVSKSPPEREMDMLLTAGERISMSLLSMALSDLGVPAVSFTGSQSGILTNDSHGKARIHAILGDRLRQALGEGKVAIVAGFQGVSHGKEITTLGRGGSDTTAVGLAVALKAARCEIYTDVDGIFSADPRWVKAAKHWKRIPGDLTVELASRGAGVLHVRSAELALERGMELRVLSSFGLLDEISREAEPGTIIMNTKIAESRGMEAYQIVGVTADLGKILLRIQGAGDAWQRELWKKASDGCLAFLAPQFAGTQGILFVERTAVASWERALQELQANGVISSWDWEGEQVPISVVGYRFLQDGAALHEVWETLAQHRIVATMGAASALGATLAVPAERAQDAVRVLHARFIEGE